MGGWLDPGCAKCPGTNALRTSALEEAGISVNADQSFNGSIITLFYQTGCVATPTVYGRIATRVLFPHPLHRPVPATANSTMHADIMVFQAQPLPGDELPDQRHALLDRQAPVLVDPVGRS
jgi:hypothetical protein